MHLFDEQIIINNTPPFLLFQLKFMLTHSLGIHWGSSFLCFLILFCHFSLSFIFFPDYSLLFILKAFIILCPLLLLLIFLYSLYFYTLLSSINYDYYYKSTPYGYRKTISYGQWRSYYL